MQKKTGFGCAKKAENVPTKYISVWFRTFGIFPGVYAKKYKFLWDTGGTCPLSFKWSKMNNFKEKINTRKRISKEQSFVFLRSMSIEKKVPIYGFQ